MTSSEACVHHWLIDAEFMADGRVMGRCKRCGAERSFNGRPATIFDQNQWNGPVSPSGQRYQRPARDLLSDEVVA